MTAELVLSLSTLFHPECSHFASKCGHQAVATFRLNGPAGELAPLLPLSHPMKPATQLPGSADEARVSVRVDVVGEHTICAQARAYAEYRVFAALTQITETQRVRRARVVLRSISGEGRGELVTCTVTVALGGAESFRVRATGAHAYAAINRAVERIV